MRQILLPAAAALLALSLAGGCGPQSADEGKPPVAQAPAPAPSPAPAPVKQPEPAKTPEPVKPPGPAPTKQPEPAPVKQPEPVKPPAPVKDPAPAPSPAPAKSATVTLTITLSGSGKAAPGATVAAVCGDKQAAAVSAGADGKAEVKDLAKGIWSFKVAAKGCYGVVGVVNVDPEAAQTYALPIALDPEEPAEAPVAPAAPEKK
jgi:hypothetical protein